MYARDILAYKKLFSLLSFIRFAKFLIGFLKYITFHLLILLLPLVYAKDSALKREIIVIIKYSWRTNSGFIFTLESTNFSANNIKNQQTNRKDITLTEN